MQPSLPAMLSASRRLENYPLWERSQKGRSGTNCCFFYPSHLALSFFAPGAITPLLMIGGAYLCYEGTEKVYEAFSPHRAHAHETLLSGATDPLALENEKVSGAIKTDFILSAEIMAITLASIPDGNIWTQALVLGVVGIEITALVYGGVAIIVKADDIGVALARYGSRNILGRVLRAGGRGIVLGMPYLLKILSIVGTAAMIWVGGGIIVHGLEHYGASAIGRTVHSAAQAAADALSPVAGLIEWSVAAAGSGIVGLAVGAVLIPIASYIIAPAWKRVRSIREQTA